MALRPPSVEQLDAAPLEPGEVKIAVAKLDRIMREFLDRFLAELVAHGPAALSSECARNVGEGQGTDVGAAEPVHAPRRRGGGG